MSVYCEVNEQFILKDTASESVRAMMAEHLRYLSSACGDSLVICVNAGTEADGMTSEYAGEDPEAALALLSEGPAECRLRYISGTDKTDPALFARSFKALSAEEHAQVRFVFWENMLGEDMGAVYGYGSGMPDDQIPFVPVDEVPEGGDWFTNAPGFFVDGSVFTPELIEACRDLSISAGTSEPEKGLCRGGLYASPDLVQDGDYPFFTLNHIGLPGREKVKAFAARMSEVLRLIREPEYETDILDVNALCPRMLRLTVRADGSVAYALSSAEK